MYATGLRVRLAACLVLSKMECGTGESNELCASDAVLQYGFIVARFKLVILTLMIRKLFSNSHQQLPEAPRGAGLTSVRINLK